MKLPENMPAEQIFREFCQAYKSRDLETLLSLCAKNINMWGSGLDEYRVGLEQVKKQLLRDWSQSEKAEIELVSFVQTEKDALWTAAICNARITIDGNEHVFPHLRGTIIIEKENGTWKVSHMHASFPDYRNAENASFPVN